METTLDVSTKKYVYLFGGGRADGDRSKKALLGGKGANLAEMSLLGLAVPPGFTITTEVCSHYYANDRRYREGLAGEVDAAMARIEAQVGARFGDPVAARHPHGLEPRRDSEHRRGPRRLRQLDEQRRGQRAPRPPRPSGRW